MAERKNIKTSSFELSVYMSGDEDTQKLALVLPGRLDTKDYPHMLSHVDYLANLGYLAITFDPPGTWESPGGIELYTMTNYLKAVNELIELFGNKPTVLLGHSRGGSMAMLAGSLNDFVTHVICVMSKTAPSRIDEGRIVDDYVVSYRDMPFSDSENQKEFKLPLTYFADAETYNILENIKRCIKPKLFFLGRKDTIISPKSVIEDFRQASEPKQLVELDSIHDYRKSHETIDIVNEEVKQFLKTYA